MTPRTRTSNRDADFKLYYSKKVPQQVYFPHKSKTVRRRSTPSRDGQEKRQMVFLPDKMRRHRAEVIDDSDENSGMSDTDVEKGVEEESIKTSKRKGRKRSSDIMNEEPDSEHDDSIPNTSKRNCKTASLRSRRRIRHSNATGDSEMGGVKNLNIERTLRRQSTMTQLIDGRKPLLGIEEPDFKPLKKISRLSWSGKGKSEMKSRDQKQRTLTQMLPGIRPSDIISDEGMEEALSDAEAEDKHDQAYGDAVAQRLAQQGLYQTGDNDGDSLAIVKPEEGMEPMSSKEEEDGFITDSQAVTETILQSVEDECDDSYKPTQFIEAPSRRPDRATRSNARGQAPALREAPDTPQRSMRLSKARFSLLSTPEKRRIREIPSSESPADSPVSTRITPLKLNQSPLKQCLSNANSTAAETPSKRKQVTFSMPSEAPIPPPRLRRFESTIQDSEDEDSDIIEEDEILPRRMKKVIGEDVKVATPPESIGADTQRMLGQMDRVCAEANGTGGIVGSESLPESSDSPIVQGHNEPSPELGEFHKQSHGQSGREVQDVPLPDYDGPARIKQEPESEDEDDRDFAELPSVLTKSFRNKSSLRDDRAMSTEAQIPGQTERLHSTPPIFEADFQETFPLTPMTTKGESSDEEGSLNKDSTPLHSSRRPVPQPTSVDVQQPTDLDSESVQVPRSPSPQHESQQSHSSEAEQQLHNEWLSYSQYVTARPPGSSSVRVAPDAFSYDATPRPHQNPAPPLPPQHQSSGYLASQATTVDEITQRTPRTKRTKHFSSAHTTPNRITSSRPIFISPSKPPPLFIPSSFPSPDKMDTSTEGWSSPLMTMTQETTGGNYRSSQWASLEDFSIPPPPPPPLGEGDED